MPPNQLGKLAAVYYSKQLGFATPHDQALLHCASAQFHFLGIFSGISVWYFRKMEIPDEILESLENQEEPKQLSREIRNRTNWPRELRQKAVEVYTETANMSETSRLLGVPLSTIHAWIRSPENKELVESVSRAHAQLFIARCDELAGLALGILQTHLEQGLIKGKEAAIVFAILEDKREMLLKQQAVLGLPLLQDPTNAYFQALEQEHAVAQELKRRAAVRAQAKEGELVEQGVDGQAPDGAMPPPVADHPITPPIFGEELPSELVRLKQSSTEGKG